MYMLTLAHVSFAALIALFTAFDSIINLVSVCTLFTFFVVACGIMWRHYYLPGKTKPWIAAGAIFWNVATSLGAHVISSHSPCQVCYRKSVNQ